MVYIYIACIYIYIYIYRPYIYIYIYIYSLMGRMFANDSGDRDSIPGPVILKAKKNGT